VIKLMIFIKAKSDKKLIDEVLQKISLSANFHSFKVQSTASPLKASESKGFTLLEIIIAISILGLIVGVSYSSLTNIMRSKEALTQERENANIASAVLSRLTRELQMSSEGLALLPPRDDLQNFYPGRVNLLGEAGKTRDTNLAADSISFLALEGGQYLPDGGSHSGIVQVSYYLQRNKDVTDEEVYHLFREETPYIRPVERAYERTITFPIADNVMGLSFLYYDSESDRWLSSWGTEGKTGNPSKIEFAIFLRGAGGKIQQLKSSVALRRVN